MENKDTNSVVNIAKGASIIFGGKLSGKILLFVYTVFLTSWLTPKEIGLYFLGLTIMVFINTLANIGLRVGVTRYVSIYSSQNKWDDIKTIFFEATIFSIIIGTFFALLLFFMADWLSVAVFKKSELGWALKILSFAILPTSLMWNFLSATRGLKLMRYTAIIEEFGLIAIRFALAFLMVSFFDLGFSGVLWAFVLSNWICMICSLYFALMHLPKQGKGHWSNPLALMLLKFSLPMVFSQFIGNLIRQIDVIMIGIFLSASDVGVYSIAIRIILLAEIVFRVFSMIFNPYAAEFYANSNFDKLSHFLKLITKWNFTISFPLFLSISCFPVVFLHFFGSEFFIGSTCLVVLSITHLISSFSDLPASIIFMSGKTGITLKNNIAALFVNTILNIILIPNFGILGAALATGTTLILLGLIRIVELYKLIEIHPFSNQIITPLILGSFLMGLLIPLELRIQKMIVIEYHFIIISLLILFLISYFGIIVLFGLNDQELYIRQKIFEIILPVKRKVTGK